MLRYIELWDAREQFGELGRSNYSLLSALQTCQVHHIAEKIAFLLINCKLVVTRGTEKQTLLLAGYKHLINEIKKKIKKRRPLNTSFTVKDFPN